MNKQIIVFLLLLAIESVSYAQKFPVKVFYPKFPTASVRVNIPTLRSNIQSAALQADIKSPKHIQVEVAKTPLIKSVFRAFPQEETDGHAMSGFIFKTIYQGNEEIFGVIAQHAMPTWNGHGKIKSSFTARVMQNNQVVDIPAEVVQFSAPIMPDIALVKFRPEDEKLLTPLTLDNREPAPNELLHIIGFGTEKLTFITNSPLLETSLLSLRFPLTGNPEEWPGLCGSPVLNAKGEIVGTVTGAARRKNLPEIHTMYATRNLYLHTLVNAYHGDIQKSSFPLILNGEKIIDLQTNEFVSQIILRDENGKITFKKNIYNKFPYSTILEQLPNARYMELYIDYVMWSGYSLIEGASVSDLRYVVYDLQEKQVVMDKPKRSY